MRQQRGTHVLQGEGTRDFESTYYWYVALYAEVASILSSATKIGVPSVNTRILLFFHPEKGS
ncbi:MAG: hypothetical protein NZ706_09590 [Candidatus Caldatribacterium sp.]|nr:hypothetical protein [Candidatus Caldatribacterium sp.]